MGMRLRLSGPKQTKKDALSSTRLMRRIARDAIHDIVSRTKGGRDYRGRFFTAYSEQYAKWKGQRRVDLTLSGDMLGSLVPQRLSRTGFQIGFNNSRAREIAGYHEGGGRVDRFFLGFSKRFEDVALRRIRDHWRRNLK